MTEVQWLASSYPDVLLRYLGNRAAPRTLRLFAAACCRRAWDYLTDECSRAAVEIVERLADGLATEGDRLVGQQTALAAFEFLSHSTAGPPALSAAQAVYRATHRQPYHTTQWSAYWAAKCGGRGERAVQADLFRDVAGNPFRQRPVLSYVPSTVSALAAALDSGTECADQLHDALLDNGITELAEHFRGARHVRGCWALELLL